MKKIGRWDPIVCTFIFLSERGSLFEATHSGISHFLQKKGVFTLWDLLQSLLEVRCTTPKEPGGVAGGCLGVLSLPGVQLLRSGVSPCHTAMLTNRLMPFHVSQSEHHTNCLCFYWNQPQHQMQIHPWSAKCQPPFKWLACMSQLAFRTKQRCGGGAYLMLHKTLVKVIWPKHLWGKLDK